MSAALAVGVTSSQTGATSGHWWCAIALDLHLLWFGWPFAGDRSDSLDCGLVGRGVNLPTVRSAGFQPARARCPYGSQTCAVFY